MQNVNNQDADSDSEWIHTDNLRNAQPNDQFAESIVSERLSLVDVEYLVDLQVLYLI